MNTVLAISGIVIKELYRRKDFYVLFVLTAVITLLMGSINFFNDDKIVRYLKDLVLLLIWISSLFIAIGTTARQLPAERENRTIFPLLAKPVTRAQIILGKFAGCWLACGLTLLVFYLFFGVVSGAREQEVSFFTVVVWRDQAEHAAQSLTKGSRVVVVGRLQQRSWTAEDGRARSVVEVVADELGPSLRWATATTTRVMRSQGQ